MGSGVRRLGVLVGESDQVVEYDLQRFLPPGVSFHVARLDQPKGSKVADPASLAIMAGSAPATALKVLPADPEFFLFACTSASFFKGPGWDRAVARSISDATGVPATTTATLVAEAFAALSVARIFMVTPYPDQANESEIAFLASAGITVEGLWSFGCRYSAEVPVIPPEEIKASILEQAAAIRACDGLLISCTMLRAVEITEDLEAALGVPIVTSNSASLWGSLRALGVPYDSVSAGRLFRLDEQKS